MKQLTNFPYSRILVLGLAKSGTAAASFLLENHKQVRVNDMQTEKNEDVKRLEKMGAELILGSHPLSVLDGVELVVKNPGIPYEHVIVEQAEKQGLPIITEVELLQYILRNDVVGITGSNGKTTTTTLITKMLEQDNQPVKVAGNIGDVAIEVAQELSSAETLVVELSSFQLLGTKTFKPHISVFLNIFEAHLDYHKSMDNYEQAKSRIFQNQTENGYLVYNADDKNVSRLVQDAKAKKIPFSTDKPLHNGAWKDEKYIYFRDEKIIKISDIVLVGKHNVANILAAICAVKLKDVSNNAIKQVLQSFSGVKHRLQYIDRKHDRQFYNDSKATNILATQTALKAFEKPVILLAGGLDRGNEFTSLAPFLKNVEAFVLFGETKEKLAQLGKEANIKDIEKVENMEEAVNKAYTLSKPGDVILLSPACASWDQYRTFEERGDMFIESVHKLP